MLPRHAESVFDKVPAAELTGSAAQLASILEQLRRHLTRAELAQAREQAQQRLDASLARLREDGIDARGEVGDGDPLQAIEDALRTFGADQIVISTHPPERSNWLEAGVVERARGELDIPVKHVVVDLTRAGAGV